MVSFETSDAWQRPAGHRPERGRLDRIVDYECKRDYEQGGRDVFQKKKKKWESTVRRPSLRRTVSVTIWRRDCNAETDRRAISNGFPRNMFAPKYPKRIFEYYRYCPQDGRAASNSTPTSLKRAARTHHKTTLKIDPRAHIDYVVYVSVVFRLVPTK